MTVPGFRRKRQLRVGFDMESNEPLSIALDYLATHLHILGPPGSGKTRWLLWLFQQLARIPNASVFFFTSKGAACHQARDWAISRGLRARIDWLGLDDPDHVLGYSPLRPNGLPSI